MDAQRPTERLNTRESLRLLAVEDSDDDLRLLLREIRASGIDVRHERVDTESAMRSALQRGGWDIVLCDFSMPEFTALDALRVLKEEKLDIPAIIVSGTVGEEMAVRAMREGAADYILKGRIARLVPAIRRELEAKEARKTHRETERQLLQLQKMEAIGRLAGGIAHDFNNILQAVIMYCDVALDGDDVSSPIRKSLNEVKKVGQRGAALTRQLLLFSRPHSAQPRALRLGSVVSDLEKMLQRLIGEHIRLETRLGDNEVAIYMDASQLEQVILNLAVNARDAMPGGGRLLIETRDEQIEGDIGVIPVPSGRYVILSVTDTGCGIGDEALSHVFEPFFTTKPIGKGTGLGLSTVYGIVKKAGGTISVTSAPGRGSQFKIHLPVLEGCVEEPQPEGPEGLEGPEGNESQLQRGRCTILLVEDDVSLRTLISAALRRRGFEVLTPLDGEEALKVCGSWKEPIDLLITDVVMPGLSGDEVASRARAIRKGLRVLSMSGNLDENKVSAESIAKPFSIDMLIKKIQELLAHRSESQPSEVS